jgi:hypothetical protein
LTEAAAGWGTAYTQMNIGGLTIISQFEVVINMREECVLVWGTHGNSFMGREELMMKDHSCQ